MEYNADMSTIINETLGINGSMLVKIFGRQRHEIARYGDTNGKVRDIGVRQALIGRWFFMAISLTAAISIPVGCLILAITCFFCISVWRSYREIQKEDKNSGNRLKSRKSN